jgi:hypothetical protein
MQEIKIININKLRRLQMGIKHDGPHRNHQKPSIEEVQTTLRESNSEYWTDKRNKLSTF